METIDTSSIIHHPHDHAFKSAMVDIRVAREFFELHLPEHIKPLVNLKILDLQPCTFVDEQLKPSATDLLYRTEFNLMPAQPGYLYLLAEQQTNPDRWLPLRLLKYLCRALERHRAQHPKDKELPLIVPLIFYTGREAYSYSTDFFNLFGDHQELARKLLLGTYHLVPLHDIPDEDIYQHKWVGLLELLMKQVHYRDTLILLEQATTLMQSLLTESGTDNYITSMLYYLLDQGEVKNVAKLYELIRKKLPKNMETTIMTFKEHCKQQGEATIILEMLKHRFGSISSQDQDRIYNADPHTLLQWSRKLFDAKTLQDVLN